MSEPLNIMPAELCDQKCGTIDCHQYGCIILNSQAPDKDEESDKVVSSLNDTGSETQSVAVQTLAVNSTAEATR